MLEAVSPFDVSQSQHGWQWLDKTGGWVESRKFGLLCVGVGLQLVVLSSIIAIHATPLVVGERILLPVQPVDPRDIFRGDYVVLSYDFSRMPAGGIEGLPAAPRWRRGSPESWLEDRTVYAQLEPEADGKHYRTTALSVNRPSSGRYLKGRYSPRADGTSLHFGIEAFYVEEGRGAELERLRNARLLSAEVAVTPWGQASLCALK